MSLIVCPPASAAELDTNGPVPHPGFGVTYLTRNGRPIWFDFHGDGYGDMTVGQLTEWCPVRQGVGWKLFVDGPLKNEVYQLRKGRWRLVEQGMGFA